MSGFAKHRTRQSRWLAFGVVAAMAGLGGGCERILGIEDTVVVTSGSPVYGTAVGLIEPVKLQLAYGDSSRGSEILTILQDGPFVFASELPRGTSYRVALASAADEESGCTLQGERGVIEEESPQVTLICPAALADLQVTGRRAPMLAFVPTELNPAVQVSLLQETISVIATARHSDVAITVGDMAVTSGEPSQEIPLRLGTTSIPIVLRHGESGASVSYVLTVHRAAAIAQQAYGKASNTSADDKFGFRVALSRVGDTLAVGAYWQDSAGPENPANGSVLHSGAVYVFARTESGWSQEAYLKASNPDAHDFFGHSVALSRTGDTLAVGAPGEASAAAGVNGDQANNSARDSGAVYVFARTEAGWSQQAYLKASNPDAHDSFGHSVALSATGDTLAVGAPAENSADTGMNGNQADNSAVNSGAVYVFAQVEASWRQEAYIKASNTDAQDRFGWSVALAPSTGNILAVGAPYESGGATGINGDEASNSAVNSGAVYVFARENATWSQQAYVKASNTASYDHFGVRVALSSAGDTLAVGAPQEDSGSVGIDGNQVDHSAADSGAVYVFTRQGMRWRQQAYLKASNTGPGDAFGSSVALSRSGDTLAVGANGEDSAATGLDGNQADDSAPESGAVYVFAREQMRWRQQAYLKASNTGPGDAFGSSVALSRSGDTLAVGAHGEDSAATGVNGTQTDDSAPESGAVYFFY